MILFPAVLHQGFNFGYNIAESVNFGTTGWLDNLKSVKSCHCQKDNFELNKEIFLKNLNLCRKHKITKKAKK